MVLDDLYLLIQAKLMAADIGVRSVQWYEGQPELWEADTTQLDGALLPCVLVRYEDMPWFGTGHTHYMCDAVIYIDVVQYPMTRTLANDNNTTALARNRSMFQLGHLVQKALVRTARSPDIGMFQLAGPCKQDRDFTKLRVETIAFRCWLKTDIDPRSYVPGNPPLADTYTINAPVVHGDFSNRHFNNDFYNL